MYNFVDNIFKKWGGFLIDYLCGVDGFVDSSEDKCLVGCGGIDVVLDGDRRCIR